MAGSWRKILEGLIDGSTSSLGKKQYLHLVHSSTRASAQPQLVSAEADGPVQKSDSDTSATPASRAVPRPPVGSDEFFGFEPFVDETVIARFLGLEPRRVLELARERQITSHPIGETRKTWRFRISEVAADFDRLRKPARATMRAAVPGTKERNRLG